MLQIETDKREQTTAVTDLMLAGAALGAIWRLRTGRGWRARLWQLAFGLLVISSLLGQLFMAYGFQHLLVSDCGNP